MRGLCSLRNTTRFRHGNINENSSRRAPHINYSQHDHTTLNYHSSMQITYKLYCVMSGRLPKLFVERCHLSLAWAFHYDHIRDVMTFLMARLHNSFWKDLSNCVHCQYHMCVFWPSVPYMYTHIYIYIWHEIKSSLPPCLL